MFDSKQIWVKKIVCQKKNWVKSFWVIKILANNIFWVKKNLVKNIFGQKIFWSKLKKKFGRESFGQKNFEREIFLIKKIGKQAGAELCQAGAGLCQAQLSLKQATTN